MKNASYINFGCLLISMFCLSVGYIQYGYWVILPVTIGISIMWIVRQKLSNSWLISVLFCATVVFAAIGLIIKLSFPLMSITCIAILISWDLTRFIQSTVYYIFPFKKEKMQNHHLGLLAILCVSSIILSYLSFYIQIQIPFGIMIVLVCAIIFCFTYFIRKINKQQGQ